MEFNVELDGDSSCIDLTQRTPLDTFKANVRSFSECLAHAFPCRNAICGYIGCRQMKIIMLHYRFCNRTREEGCKICKMFIEYCFHHAKMCLETECPVLFCSRIKERLMGHELEQDLAMEFTRSQ